MLAGLYIGYVIVLAKLQARPDAAAADERAQRAAARRTSPRSPSMRAPRVVPALMAALKGRRERRRSRRRVIARELLRHAVARDRLRGADGPDLARADQARRRRPIHRAGADGVVCHERAGESRAGEAEPAAAKEEGGLSEPPAEGLGEPPKSARPLQPQPRRRRRPLRRLPQPPLRRLRRRNPSLRRRGCGCRRRPCFWIVFAVGARMPRRRSTRSSRSRGSKIFKMLLSSFFPLAVLILAVLGTIVFGLATPTEAAAVGSFGGFALAAVYALLNALPRGRGRILKTWVPLWVLMAVSVVWFLLLKFEVLESGPPMWVGWVTIVATAVWCVLRGVPGASSDRDRQGVGVPHREDVGDGVLAVRRLVDLLGGVRAARRPGGRRALGAVAGPDADPVHDPRAGHHLPARLAARVDGDHRHLHADLHPAAGATSTSTRCSSACWSRSTCRRRSCRRRWRWPRSTSRACRRRT